MEHDVWLFIGVFVFIFFLWISTGGPTHPISFAGPTLLPPSPIGGGTYLRLPQAPFAIGTSNVNLANSQEGDGSYTGGTGGTLAGISFGAPSSYRGTVALVPSVVNAASANPAEEYLQIYLSAGAPGPVTISGWTIESEASGNSVSIPLGTEVPLSGTVNAVQAITLTPGDTAIVDSGRSPIGASFRENKCIGYFGEFQHFSPPFTSTCPTAESELERFYGPNYIHDLPCIRYVEGLNRCQVAITPPAGASSACQYFLENHLNYNGCVTGHQNDSDFKSPTWRVYLGRDSAMWRTRYEVVKLIDSQGKTVDAFSY